MLLGHTEQVRSRNQNGDPLVDLAIKGDQSAIETLYNKYKPLLFFSHNHFKSVIPSDEIEGCYDEAFVTTLNTFNESYGCQFVTHLKNILHRTIFANIPSYSDIYIPKILRYRVFRIMKYLGCNNVHDSSVHGFTIEHIEMAKAHYGWDTLNSELVMYVIPILFYELSDSFNYEEALQKKDSFGLTVEQSTIDESDVIRRDLANLIETVLNLYFHGEEKVFMKNIMRMYVQSLANDECYAQRALQVYGYDTKTTSRKCVYFFDVLREYCQFNDIKIDDYF
ncbi:hypothetical protein HUO09_17065 [Vibrio sp. Y2-5]|uniref:hypothetical protein n=1 Tax=Vibrio sp. Y2-5 TaxID=2743977 RepID=UPI0016610E2E|nr:hypothetical protein [Vibrio sp. Y2-5]MBD0788067.1 hypothetical protein [Vibrio sp. Y2-5]